MAVQGNISPSSWQYRPRAAQTTEDQYSPVRLEQAWLVSSLVHGDQTCLFLICWLSRYKNTLWKRSVWHSSDQETTNQNAHIYLKVITTITARE